MCAQLTTQWMSLETACGGICICVRVLGLALARGQVSCLDWANLCFKFRFSWGDVLCNTGLVWALLETSSDSFGDVPKVIVAETIFRCGQHLDMSNVYTCGLQLCLPRPLMWGRYLGDVLEWPYLVSTPFWCVGCWLLRWSFLGVHSSAPCTVWAVQNHVCDLALGIRCGHFKRCWVKTAPRFTQSRGSFFG